eukprot:jgi/Tetstr1/426955/TSEL_017168.t1
MLSQHVWHSSLWGKRLPSPTELQREMVSLRDDVMAFARQRPEIDGVEKLVKSIKGKLTGSEGRSFALLGGAQEASTSAVEAQETLAESEGAEAAGEGPSQEREAALKQVQGAVNNLRGMRAELVAAEALPEVVAVSRKFHSRPEEGQVYDGERSDALVASSSHGEWSERRGLAVEVDVVAMSGAWWVEVKSHEAFGTTSTHWLGNPGHVKGLREQAVERLAVARSPCNLVRWRSPSVVFFFPQGVDAGVAAELREMGAHVMDGAAPLEPQFPPRPPPPAYANLDVTAMCALVSEVANGGAESGGTPEVLAWAARISHWVDCVAAEAEDPLLPRLMPVLEGRQLIASSTAVAHFEKLLATCGGPRETTRLAAVAVPHPGEARDGGGGWPGAEPHEFFSRRVARLGQVAPAQKWVLGLSDTAQAMTVTANGKVLKSAAKQGVELEAFVHRAMWLSGL